MFIFLILLTLSFLNCEMSAKLFCRRDDPVCWRVMLYMNETRRPFEVKWMNVEKNEHKTSEFRKLSPHGTLPVLTFDDVTICGGTAIINYFEATDEKNSFSKTVDPKSEYGLSVSRMEGINVNLMAAFKHFLATYSRSVESSYLRFEKLLEELDKFNEDLNGKTYLGGDKKGLDDICLYPVLYSLTLHYGLNLELFQFSHLVRFMKNFEVVGSKKEEIFQATEGLKLDLESYQKEFVNLGYGRELVPKTIKVSKYVVSLEPTMEKFEFKGIVDVQFEFTESTSEIILNAKDIIVTSAELSITEEKKDEDEEGEGEVCESKVVPYMIDFDKKKDWVCFYFDKVFTKGSKATLKIEYDGKIGDKMSGLYRSKYKNKAGEDAYMAVTQFQSVDARRCLPCIDEPAHKAVFECILILEDGYDGISNMDVVKTEVRESDKKTVLTFAPSVPMSTYLLAFAVMNKEDYGYVEGYTTEGGKDGKGGLRVRVWSLKKEDGRFALDTTIKGIPLYEEYFDEKFPLMKLDLLCVSEFAAGAMENWGLITFRETAVLVSEGSAAATKQRVAIVVTHEVAHMWFGNLVTMEWWADIWLNEGFAVWCEYFIADQLYPEMKLWEEYVTSDFVRAMSSDSLESSHPIEVHVTKAIQIDEIFDVISYLKGCAVVRMVVDYLGIEVFRAGIIKYLKEFKYGNACTRDLWRILEETSGKEVNDIMEGWTKQTGYPFVTVSVLEEKEKEIVLELTQKKFLSTGIKEEDSTVWPIPISYKLSQGGKVGGIQKLLMRDHKMKLTIPIEEKEKVDWIFFNPGLTGFYRVLYDENLFLKLTKSITNLEELDRFAIQNDYVDFMKVGLTDLGKTLDLLRCYKSETSYSVINGVSTSVSKLYGLVKYDEESAKLFHKFGQELYGGMKAEYGVLEDMTDSFSHVQIHLQSLVVDNLLKFLDPDLVKLSMDFFKNKPDKISPDLLDKVYSTVVKNGGEEGFEAVKKVFMESDRDELKVRCLKSLAQSSDVEIAKNALEWMMTDEVKDQDKIYLFIYTAMNVPFGRDIIWEFFKKNVGKLKEMYKDGMMMPYFVQYSIAGFNDEAIIPEIEEFYGNNPIEGAEMSLRKGIEGIRVKCKWIKKDKDDLVGWLKKNFGE